MGDITKAREALKDPEIERKRRAKISATMKRKIAESKEWQESLKERGTKSQFNNGYDKRRFGKRNWKPESLKNIGKHTNRKRGKDHHNWKGGVTSENHKIRTSSPEYKTWRLAVYKRDHYNCQGCGTHCTSQTIVAHHIKSFSDFPKLRFEINNGITYCRKCHIKLHKK